MNQKWGSAPLFAPKAYLSRPIRAEDIVRWVMEI